FREYTAPYRQQRAGSVDQGRSPVEKAERAGEAKLGLTRGHAESDKVAGNQKHPAQAGLPVESALAGAHASATSRRRQGGLGWANPEGSRFFFWRSAHSAPAGCMPAVVFSSSLT